MATDIQSVIDRIQKLLKLSKSPNEHEAASAAAKAAALMQEYELTEAALEVSVEAARVEATENVVVEQGARAVTWKVNIVHGLAKLNRCECYTSGGQIHVFGRRAQTQTVAYTYQYLVREVDRLCEEQYAAVGRYEARTPRGWKNAFRLGCANRLYHRLAALAQTESQHRALDLLKKAPEETKALRIVQKKDLQVQTDWAQFCKETNMRTGVTRTVRYSDRSGYARGQAAGATVGLGTGRAALGATPGQIKGR